MKLLEGDFDSDVNIGNLGNSQEKVGETGVNPEEYGYTEEMGKTNREVGALSAMVAHGILGWTSGQKGLDLVMQSESLSDSTKEYIKNMVDSMGQDSSSEEVEMGSENNSDDHSSSSEIEPEHTYLQEQLKKKIRDNFNRFLI